MPPRTLTDEAGCCVRLFVVKYCIHIGAAFLSCVCYAYEAILSRSRRGVQMLMGNIVGVVDGKCVGVVYYVYRAAFVVIDVAVLYIGAA